MKNERIQRVLKEHLQANATASTLASLGDFLILWGVFEKRYFSYPNHGHHGYNVKFKLEHARVNSDIIIRDMETPIGYFRKRYLLDLELGEARFRNLEIGGSLTRETRLGLEEAATDSEKRVTLFSIMQALRNNLFHGKKEPGGIE